MQRILGLLLLCLVPAADSGQVEYVRQDALVFQSHYHAPLDTVTIGRYWEATAIRSESMYNGNGSWGLGYSDWPTRPYESDHPLVRVVARHVLGLLTLIEDDLADTLLVRRARMGLNWLMYTQTKEGAWPVFTTPQGAVTHQSIYPTALAGRALARAHRVLGNPRYLLASIQGLNWEQHRPQDDSPLNHALYLAHILEHYRTARQYRFLQMATKEVPIILNRQLPNGSWNDPAPLATGEHAMVTESLLILESLLDDTQPVKRRLQAGVTAALNFLLENQLADGSFGALSPEILLTKVPTYEIVTFIKALEVRHSEEFNMAITGAVHALNNHESNTGFMWRSTQADRFFAMAEALVWFVHQPGHPHTQEKAAVIDSTSVQRTAPESTGGIPAPPADSAAAPDKESTPPPE